MRMETFRATQAVPSLVVGLVVGFCLGKGVGLAGIRRLGLFLGVFWQIWLVPRKKKKSVLISKVDASERGVYTGVLRPAEVFLSALLSAVSSGAQGVFRPTWGHPKRGKLHEPDA